MKKILLRVWLLFLFFISFEAKSQVLEWLNIFETHSAGAGAGIQPNSLIDSNGKITTIVVENDTLKFYQTFEDGEIINSLNSNKRINGEYSPLIKIGQNQQAMVFKAGPYPGAFWLLQTDSNLDVIRESQLVLPQGIVFPSIHNLIEYNEELYITMTTNGNHYLLRINDDDTLSVVYNGSISIAYGEEYLVFENGNIIFSYRKGNGQIIRCISAIDGILIWEESINTGFGTLLDYRIAKNENILYTLGKERTWINGSAVDKLTMSHIDILSGKILFQQPLNLPSICSNCSIGLNDFIYNEVNNRLYVSYESGFPNPAILLMEVNSQTAEVITESYFPFQPENEFFQLTKRSTTHIKPDGSLIFIYKSYKNETEQMNLYIALLNSQLESINTFEFNIEELESIEHPTDVLNYDFSRLLITGIVPNKNPSISLEQAEYFTFLLNTDEMLSVNETKDNDFEIKAYPNPTKDRVTFILAENESFEMLIYNISGQLIFHQTGLNGNYILDTMTFPSGIYVVSLKGKYQTYIKTIVKN